MSLTAEHRERAYALLLGEHGTAPHVIEANRYHRVLRPLEKAEQAACERAVQVVIDPPTPTAGWNNPLDGRDLSTYPVTVRVSYARTDAGDQYDAGGASSGPGDVEAIEDRAAMDLKQLRDVFGWQPNWSSLDPAVIDPAPSGAAPSKTVLDDRVIYEQAFAFLTRASLPGSYGPSQT